MTGNLNLYYMFFSIFYIDKQLNILKLLLYSLFLEANNLKR